METLADRVALVQAESARLLQYLHALPADAWSQPSACTQWQIQDVVAHVAGAAEFYVDTLTRGLQGDTTPPEGFPSAGTVNAAAMAEPLAHMARATREQLGDQVLATCEAALTRLNALLAGVSPHEWERPCYHPWRLMPVQQFLPMSLQELEAIRKYKLANESKFMRELAHITSAEEYAILQQAEQFRKRYTSDLTDEQWVIVAPLIPPATHNPRGGRPRKVEIREVLNTLFYQNRPGCQWDMLPHDLLPKSTVYDYFSRWRDDGTWEKLVTALREQTRGAAGREPTPSAACIDSQAVKTTEVGGPERGYDGGKKIKGRKRHLLVDTLGLLLAVLITSAGLDAGVAAPILLDLVTPQAMPRLSTIFADQKYHNHALDAWMAQHRPRWHIAVQERPAGTKGFTPLATRWVIERTNAWNGRYRRNSKDYERKGESSTAMIQLSNRHQYLRQS